MREIYATERQGLGTRYLEVMWLFVIKILYANNDNKIPKYIHYKNLTKIQNFPFIFKWKFKINPKYYSFSLISPCTTHNFLEVCEYNEWVHKYTQGFLVSQIDLLNIGLTKKVIWIFHYRLWKNLKEIFCPPHRCMIRENKIAQCCSR